MTPLKQLMKMAQTMRLLYVEDDTPLQDEMTMLLSDFFGTIALASDGQEGLEQYRKETYDLVITDIKMPKMDGIAMIREIKKENPQQPIVVVSAYNEVEYLMQMIELGVDSFITKPLESNQVLQTLERCVCHIHDAKALLHHQEKLQELNASLKEEVAKQSKSLRESYAKMAAYQNAFTKMGHVMILDATGSIVNVNQHLASLLGYEQAQLVQQSADNLWHSATPAESVEAYRQSLEAQQGWSGEAVMRTRALQPLHVSLMISPIFLKEGAVEFLVVLQDLSASKHAFEEKTKALELCQHQQMFSKLLYTLPLPAVIVDKNGYIGVHNLEFIEMIEEGIQTGLMRRLKAGKLHLSEMITAEDDRLETPSWWHQSRQGVTIYGDYETILGNMPVQVKIKSLKEDEAKCLAVLCYQGVGDDAL